MNWEAIFWLAAMVIFIIAEATTVTLVSIWFAVGALGAILIALLGGGLTLQVTVFLALAIVLLIFLRGAVRKHFAPRITRTNVDSVIGATGIVVTPVNNIAALGQVQINGVEWSARSTDGSHIGAGALVKVDKIEGVKVFVSLAQETPVA
jgi:membrane protein implicated in regulation of membrane protease activity